MNHRMLSGVVVFLAATAAIAQDADKKAIVSAYAALDKAINSKNVNGMTAYMTSDFKMKSQMGQTVTRDQFVSAVKSQIGMAQSISSKTTVQSVVIKGTTATVSTSGVSKLVILEPQTKAAHKIDVSSKSVATWVKVQGSWKMKFLEQKDSKVLMDGKPMQMPTGGKPKSKPKS